MKFVGITVSTNYADLLDIIVPCNIAHFKRWFIITDANDKDTIKVCKKYPVIEIIFYDFKTHPLYKFNKGGGLRRGQEIAYQKFPNDWYLIIDSDIILPKHISLKMKKFVWQTIIRTKRCDKMYRTIMNNSFSKPTYKIANLIQRRKYLKDIVLGCKRELYYKMSDINRNHPAQIPSHQPLNFYGGGTCSQGCPGYFQLYNYHRYYKDGMGGEDIEFSGNFTTKAEFTQLIVKHLGHVGVNWKGRKGGDFLIDEKLKHYSSFASPLF